MDGFLQTVMVTVYLFVYANKRVIQTKAKIYFLFMIFRRVASAGIRHDQSFLVFGGYKLGNPTNYLSSTEIITEQGGVSPGPEIPQGIAHRRLATVNATTSILTGGSTTTWFFNHVSQQFQPGPPLNNGRYGHASGTVQDHVTKENIVVVVGGVKAHGSGAPFDSTEILINGESEWQQGKKLIKLKMPFQKFKR